MGSDSPNLYLYITKSWIVAFNAAAFTLRHINYHVIFKNIYIYNFSFNFKIVFTIFNPINAAYYLFIYFHYYSIIIQPTSYLFSSTIKPNPKPFQFSLKEKKNLYQYITKSSSVAFNVVTLPLSHVSNHLIINFFI